MPEVLIRASTACEIVGFDLAKLNEAIARGTYTPAPPTRKGSSRLFDKDELLRLYFFARLIYFGHNQHIAGLLSYEVVKENKAQPSDVIAMVMSEYEKVFVSPDSDPNQAIDESEHGPIIFKMDFYISHAQKNIDLRIMEMLERERAAS